MPKTRRHISKHADWPEARRALERVQIELGDEVELQIRHRSDGYELVQRVSSGVSKESSDERVRKA